MKTTLARTLVVAAAAAPIAFSTQAEAPKATPVNGTATLTMTFELKGSGVSRPASHEHNIAWTVEDRYSVTATMTAQKPSGFAAMHKPDAAEQKREADRQAASQDAARAMAPMQEQAAKIAEMCGNDEACMQREVMKMARGIDPNSAEMKSARSNIAKASVMPEARYQIFMPGKQSGSYRVKETAHQAYFDAGCSLATEVRCAYDTAIDGKGDIVDAGGSKTLPTEASAEIDYRTGSLLLHLTVPGMAKAKKTVSSRSAEIKTGTTDVMRSIRHNDVMDTRVEVNCGACASASGTFTKDVTDELLGRPAKLVVTWSFKRS